MSQNTPLARKPWGATMEPEIVFERIFAHSSAENLRAMQNVFNSNVGQASRLSPFPSQRQARRLSYVFIASISSRTMRTWTRPVSSGGCLARYRSVTAPMKSSRKFSGTRWS